MIESRPELSLWPEATRALLLATADYQMADGMMWGPTPTRDGHDGVGLLNASQAAEAAGVFAPQWPVTHGHDYGLLRADQFKEGPGAGPDPGSAGGMLVESARYLDRVWQIEAAAGDRVRAAFTWNSNVDSAQGPSVLEADLDLRVLDPDGDPVAWSMTWDNNYELIDFPAAKTGTYRLVVFGFDISSSFESYFGVAWMATDEDCGPST